MKTQTLLWLLSHILQSSGIFGMEIKSDLLKDNN